MGREVQLLPRPLGVNMRLTEEQEKDLDEMADNFKKTKGGK